MRTRTGMGVKLRSKCSWPMPGERRENQVRHTATIAVCVWMSLNSSCVGCLVTTQQCSEVGLWGDDQSMRALISSTDLSTDSFVAEWAIGSWCKLQKVQRCRSMVPRHELLKFVPRPPPCLCLLSGLSGDLSASPLKSPRFNHGAPPWGCCYDLRLKHPAKCSCVERCWGEVPVLWEA